MRKLLPIALAVGVLAGCGSGSDAARRDPPPAEPKAEREQGDGPLRADGSDPELETVATRLDTPWDIAFLPDGRALITERKGTVRLLDAGGKLAGRPVGQVGTTPDGESGLLGVAVDPKFKRNRFVYFYRRFNDENEVVRYRFANSKLTGAQTITGGIKAAANHDGGRIHFGPDGALYIATGDAQIPELSRDPGSPNGKILRLRDFRGGETEAEVFSRGHRNVQGFDWDAQGRLLATEFGENDNDEVNLIRQGRDYGWPEATGDASDKGSQPALKTYADVIAPSGATFVSRPGSSWTGDFVFANLISEQIRRLDMDGAKVRGDEVLFEGELGRLRTVVEGPDGALYALTSNRDGRGSPRDGDDRLVRIIPPRD